MRPAVLLAILLLGAGGASAQPAPDTVLEHPTEQIIATTAERLGHAMDEGGMRGAGEAVRSCYDEAGTSRQALADCLLLEEAAVKLYVVLRRDGVAQGLLITRIPAPSPNSERDIRIERHGNGVFGSYDGLWRYLGPAPDRVVESLPYERWLPRERYVR